jgi:hypothetical protein
MRAFDFIFSSESSIGRTNVRDCGARNGPMSRRACIVWGTSLTLDSEVCFEVEYSFGERGKVHDSNFESRS